MTLNGVNTLASGMMPLQVQGAYDFPARYGNWSYDWGDEVQLLFNDANFKFGQREISVRFLYDPRRDSLPSATRVETWIQGFMEQPAEIALVLDDAVGALGSYNVKVDGVINQKKYKGLPQIFTMRFLESSPVFNGTLPLAQPAGNNSLDGYSLADLGVVTTTSRNYSTLQALFQSNVTQYNDQRPKGRYRPNSKFILDGYIVGSNGDDAVTKLHSLHKILSKQGTMNLIHENVTTEVACVEGGSFRKINKRAFKFEINLIKV